MLSRLFLLLRSSRQEVFCEKSLTCNFIKKETLAQVFSFEFWEISNNTFFTEHHWLTACGYSEKVIPSRTFLLFQVSYTQYKISAILYRLYME